MISLALPREGRRLQERLKSLYDDTDVAVSGSVGKKTAGFLERAYKSAGAAAKYAMSKFGLYPQERMTESLSVYEAPPERGKVSHGGTTPRETFINAYIVAGTDSYEKFRDWLGYQRDRFGMYLRGKLGTPERAEENVRYTLGHEVGGHVYTQLRPMHIEGGKEAEPFANLLHKRLTIRYRNSLPKGVKWLAPLIAYFAYTPLSEGLAEVTTENIYEGKSASQVMHERRGCPTSYDRFAAASAESLYAMGLEPEMESLDFYRRAVEDPGIIDRYIDGFYGSMRGMLSGSSRQAASASEIAPAMAYAPAMAA